jgi:hypothetical protein
MSRPDLFTPGHRALRAMLYDTALKVQTADFSEKEKAKAALDNLETCLSWFEAHHHLEEKLIFPDARRFVPEIVDKLLSQHQEFMKKLISARDLGNTIRGIDHAGEAVDAGGRLNKLADDLFAYFLSHLVYEEASILPATWENYTDPELMAIQSSVQADMTMEQIREWNGWFFPAQNDPDLAGMFKGLKMSAPPPVFEAMSRAAEAALGAERWGVVVRKAGLA